ncbi:MAG TPA: carboxypeptidase-like regulatory domain-containing protein [Tepidisphaeraceae bacterium]|jgi:hypothetical protein|nr:carboxypeptidase-like regulatory domain-containing protein [Tepidisphaeraceae bacterium]
MGKRGVIVGLIILILLLVSAGIYWGVNTSFPNGATGANLDVPDTGIAIPSAGPGSGNGANENAPVGKTMDFLAVDQVTKQPIVRLTVQTSGEKIRYRGTTDESGHVRVPFPTAPEDYTQNFFSIRVSGRGYVAERVVWQSSDPPQVIPRKYTLGMEKSTKVRGKIVDDDGHPVAGAVVILQFRKKSSNPHEEIDVNGYNRNKPVKSAADGSWVFTGAPRNCDEIGLTALDDHYVTGDSWSPRPFSPVSKLYDGTATFTLHRGIAVEGVVVSSDESPVEGASVGIGPNRQQDNAIPAQTTDASGKFSYAFEPGKEVVLTVRAKHYAPAMLRFTMGQEKKYATIKLSAAHWIGGKVVDTSGAPVPHAALFLESWRGNHSLREFLPTNAQGEFRWTEAPADAVTFYVSAKGLRDTTQELTPDHEQIVTLGSPVDLKLKPTPATQP